MAILQRDTLKSTQCHTLNVADIEYYSTAQTPHPWYLWKVKPASGDSKKCKRKKVAGTRSSFRKTCPCRYLFLSTHNSHKEINHTERFVFSHLIPLFSRLLSRLINKEKQPMVNCIDKSSWEVDAHSFPMRQSHTNKSLRTDWTQQLLGYVMLNSGLIRFLLFNTMLLTM